MDKKQAVPEFSVEDYDPAPEQELICVICHGVLCKPVVCPCRHVFCNYCIRTWLRRRSSCPVCRRRVSLHITPLVPAPPDILNMLGRLQVKRRGCDTRIAVKNYTSHVEECAQCEVSCPNVPCSFRCAQCDLASHLDSLCPFRKITCGLGCSLELLAKDVSEHSCIDALKQKLAARLPVIAARTAGTCSSNNVCSSALSATERSSETVFRSIRPDKQASLEWHNCRRI